MVRAIFFDLDSCLCAADEPGVALFAPAFEAIRSANRGTLDEAALAQAFEDCWRFPFDDVARRHGFSDEMRRAGCDGFGRIEVVTPIHGYGDLDVISELPVRRFLVTSGFTRLQQSKIRALGIAPLFEEIVIDERTAPKPKGKEAIFEELLSRHCFKPPEVLAVGDNPDSELAAGKRLGMITVQTLRPGVPRGANADHFVSGLRDLADLLTRLG